MAKWQAFNRNLRDIGSSLGQYAKQENEKKAAWEIYQKQKDMEFQRAIALKEAEMKMERENPLYQELEKAKLAQGLKARFDIGEDISPYLGLFGIGQPSGGTLPSGQTEVFPTPAFAPVMPVEGQDNRYEQIPDYTVAPFGAKRISGYKTQLRPEEALKQKIEETKQIELAKGIPTAESGKVALAKESIRNIEDVKGMLFSQKLPTGEYDPSSYKRGTAYGSNITFGQLPIIPSNTGFYTPQTIFRKMGASLSGRQLIQTGVAARPEETAKLVGQFAPSGLMSSKAALEGLNELQEFYRDYLYIVETKGLQAADEWAKSQPDLYKNKEQAQQTQTFNIRGKAYAIPIDKVAEFKKDMGL